MPDHPPFTARAVLADDERLMREQLRVRLAEAWPELQIVGEARNGVEAVELVTTLRPDLVFLDIRMPGLTGVEAARQIAQMPVGDDEVLPEIVFITAYDQYAVEAFEQGATDYVLKPAERERLKLTVERLQKRLAARAGNDPLAAPPIQQLLHQLSARLGGSPGTATPATSRTPGDSGSGSGSTSAERSSGGYLTWIQASVGQAIQMIAIDEVLFFISDEKYTRVQTAQVEALIRKPIKELVDELDPRQFWQIHRSTLVNTRAIAAVTRDDRGRQLVSMRGHPEKLEVSRSYGHLFKSM
ncbi:MAG: response regulator transcription factor [Burkholderiales bacterium]|nr:response regulator transcription factor [Burkholderiales bacterium]